MILLVSNSYAYFVPNSADSTAKFSRANASLKALGIFCPSACLPSIISCRK